VPVVNGSRFQDVEEADILRQNTCDAQWDQAESDVKTLKG